MWRPGTLWVSPHRAGNGILGGATPLQTSPIWAEKEFLGGAYPSKPPLFDKVLALALLADLDHRGPQYPVAQLVAFLQLGDDLAALPAAGLLVEHGLVLVWIEVLAERLDRRDA